MKFHFQKKILSITKRKFFYFNFIFSTLIISIIAMPVVSAQTDTTFISLRQAKKIKNKKEVVRVELSKEVIRRKTIPTSLKKLGYIENLSLNPNMKSFGKPINKSYNLLSKKSIIYKTFIFYPSHLFKKVHLFSKDKSRLRKFPTWIKGFKNLKEIDLTGNKKFRYKKELKKISNLTNLEELTIEPKQLDKELVSILSKFKNLKELEIKCKMKYEPTDLMEELKINLPGVNIIFSIDLE